MMVMMIKISKGVRSHRAWNDMRSRFKGGKREGALESLVLLQFHKAVEGGKSRTSGAINSGQAIVKLQDVVHLQVLAARPSVSWTIGTTLGRKMGSTYEVNSTRTGARAQYCRQARVDFCNVSIDSPS